MSKAEVNARRGRGARFCSLWQFFFRDLLGARRKSESQNDLDCLCICNSKRTFMSCSLRQRLSVEDESTLLSKSCLMTKSRSASRASNHRISQGTQKEAYFGFSLQGICQSTNGTRYMDSATLVRMVQDKSDLGQGGCLRLIMTRERILFKSPFRESRASPESHGAL